MCQGCPGKAEFLILLKKTKRGTGDLMRDTTTVLTLCGICCSELGEQLPVIKKVTIKK